MDEDAGSDGDPDSLKSQLSDPLVLLFIGAAVFSCSVGAWAEGAVIALIVTAHTAGGLRKERRRLRQRRQMRQKTA